MTSNLYIRSILLCILHYCTAKVLIISADNRDFNKNVEVVHYPSVSALLNKKYADKNGYDFVQIRENIGNLVTEVKKMYPDHNIIPPTDNYKDTATAFHFGLKQFRAASNAKLPALWYAITHLPTKYDWVFYIDSDAVISPYHFNRTIEDLLQECYDNKLVARGNPNPTDSTFVFFHNHPWRDDMPCAGTFLFRPQLGEAALREWWDFDLPSKNFKHFHEQDSLWHIIQNPTYNFKINNNTFSILSERQFPSSWKRYEDLWLCHIASYNYAIRLPILSTFLLYMNLNTQTAYNDELSKVHVFNVNMLVASQEIEMRSAAEKLRKNKWPQHDEANQLEFYNRHVTSIHEEPIPNPSLYEHRLVKFHREYWFVHNYERHGFPNFATFISMGFTSQLAFPLKRDETSTIPIGKQFTTDVRENFIYLCYNQDYNITTYNDYNRLLVDSKLQLNQTRPAVQLPISPLFDPPPLSPCILHAELDQLVKMEEYKTIMYLIVHNNASYQIAMKYASCRSDWMKITYIQSTPFFESIVYKDIILPRKDEWMKYKYVIIGTYKSMDTKVSWGVGQTLSEIYRLLKVMKHGNYDVVPFLRSGSKNMEFSTYYHKKIFREVWDTFLVSLGYSKAQIRAQDEMKGFFRNVFIAKPDVLLNISQFMNKAINVAQRNPSVKSLLEKNSNYKEGNKEVAQRIFGTPYYQMYPFVFERLPSFFLHDLNANICHNSTGPCQYNT